MRVVMIFERRKLDKESFTFIGFFFECIFKFTYRLWQLEFKKKIVVLCFCIVIGWSLGLLKYLKIKRELQKEESYRRENFKIYI